VDSRLSLYFWISVNCAVTDICMPVGIQYNPFLLSAIKALHSYITVQMLELTYNFP